jgi:hypothetical protein
MLREKSGEEIEITPAMIEAGACEVASYSPELTNSHSLAVDVYLAMEKARHRLAQKYP